MKMTSPLYRVKGLGSAKDGTHHWWMQRITAIALVPLTVWFTCALLSMASANYETVVGWFREPVNLTLMVVFIGVLFYHTKLGLQIVIEDYVHHKMVRTVALVLNSIFCLGLGVLGIVAAILVGVGG